MRRVTLFFVAVLMLAALGATWMLAQGIEAPPWTRVPYEPVASIPPAAALPVAFINHGEPAAEVGVFQLAPEPGDPGRALYWKDEATLEKAILQILAEALERKLDGEREEAGRHAAVDLVFASNHSLRVVKPGPNGERVGEIVVDRSQPDPARAGMLEVMKRIGKVHAGRFRGVLVDRIVLLNCGSHQDAGDHRALSNAVLSLTGRPPGHIITTSDKVVPEMRHIGPGFAGDRPLFLLDSSLVSGTPQTRPYLRISAGGFLDLVSGVGQGLAIPVEGE